GGDDPAARRARQAARRPMRRRCGSGPRDEFGPTRAEVAAARSRQRAAGVQLQQGELIGRLASRENRRYARPRLRAAVHFRLATCACPSGKREPTRVENSGGITASLQGRYASALFNLASEQGLVTAVESDLDKLGDAIKASPDLAALIRN